MKNSNFNKANYQAANDQITSLIKQLHDWENTEGFIADGIICPDVYEQQNFKILCILSESYGYEGCKVTSIQDQPTRDVLGLTNSSVKSPRKLATLLWLIQRSFELGRQLNFEEMPRLFTINQNNTAILQTTLSKIAWINIKKASNGNGTQQANDDVYGHAVRNKDVLRQQIDAIAPDLIISCGQVVFRALNDMRLIGTELLPGKKWQIQTVRNGPHVLEVTHPRLWWSYKALYKHFQEIYGQLLAADGKPMPNPQLIAE